MFDKDYVNFYFIDFVLPLIPIFFLETLVPLSLMIGHSPLAITIMIMTETVTAPLRSKEPGGTARAMRQISMACIFVAITLPMLMV